MKLLLIHLQRKIGSRLLGKLHYIRKDKIYFDKEKQVNGSLIYNYPEYIIFYLVRKQVEKRLGIDLFQHIFMNAIYYLDNIYQDTVIDLHVKSVSRFKCTKIASYVVSVELDGSEAYVANEERRCSVYTKVVKENISVIH